MSGCADKHNNIANKFCPECGQKLEHFDIGKLNKEYKAFVEEKKKYAKDLIDDGVISHHTHVDTSPETFITGKKIKLEQLVYIVDKTFYTEKQLFECLGITDDNLLKELFFISCHSRQYPNLKHTYHMSVDDIKIRLESKQVSKNFQTMSDDVLEEIKLTDKKDDFLRIVNNICDKINDKKMTRDEMKLFLKAFAEKL